MKPEAAVDVAQYVVPMFIDNLSFQPGPRRRAVAALFSLEFTWGKLSRYTSASVYPYKISIVSKLQLRYKVVY